MIGCKVKEVENIAWNTRKCSALAKSRNRASNRCSADLQSRDIASRDLSADLAKQRWLRRGSVCPRPPLQLELIFLLLIAAVAVKPGDTRLARSPKSEKGWAINCRPRDFLIAGSDFEVNSVISLLTFLSLQPFAESSSRSRHVLQLLTFTLQLHFSRPAREPFPPHRRSERKKKFAEKKIVLTWFNFCTLSAWLRPF